MSDLFDGRYPAVPHHPARYSAELIQPMLTLIRLSQPQARYRLLDPFGGVGGIFELQPWLPLAEISAVEIEPLWALADPRITEGDAHALPFDKEWFDFIVTSPTYGNRMADHHQAKDASKRHTYAHAYGRELQPNNSGLLQWGEAYRKFHLDAWAEAARVLRPGGHLLLNIKDHIRNKRRQYVTAWHIAALAWAGLRLQQHEKVKVPSQRHGANGDDRIEYESLLLFEKPAWLPVPAGDYQRTLDEAEAMLIDGFQFPRNLCLHCGDWVAKSETSRDLQSDTYPHFVAYSGWVCSSCARRDGLLVACEGEAHRNLFIDHCMVCSPRWGEHPSVYWRNRLAQLAWVMIRA